MRLQHIWLSSRDKQLSRTATDCFEGRDYGSVLRFKNISLFVSLLYYFIYGVFTARMLLLQGKIFKTTKKKRVEQYYVRKTCYSSK
jgi:hypothetical protein